MLNIELSCIQAAWIVEDSDQEEGGDDDDAMEGDGLDDQAMDDDREGSEISEDDRKTSVWDDDDDTRSEMMVSIPICIISPGIMLRA